MWDFMNPFSPLSFYCLWLLTINHEQAIPDDKTGNFAMIYDFLEKNWKIAKWVALGAVILEVILEWFFFASEQIYIFNGLLI